MEERHLSLSEVALLMEVSERTVRRWIKSGKLRAYKPGRDYRIPEGAIKEFIEGSEAYPKELAAPPEEEAAALEPKKQEDRGEELRKIRGTLTDIHAMLEELAEQYESSGDGDRLLTLLGVTILTTMGAEEFVTAEVGPAEDRASMRVYTAGARLEELVEDLLERAEAATAEPVVEEVARLDAWRRRKAG